MSMFLDTLWLIPVFPLLGAALMMLLGRHQYLDPQEAVGPAAHGHHHDGGHDQDVRPRQGLRWLIGPLCSGFVLLSFLWSLGAVLAGRREQVLFTWVAGLPFPAFDGRTVTLTADWGYLLDPVSAVMILMVTGIGFLIHVYSIAYMAHDGGLYRYFGCLNLFVFFMLVLVLANNYLLLFVGWEGVGLASYLLIGFYFKRKTATDAAMKAFLMNRVGDAGYLLGLLFLLSIFGTLRFTAMEAAAHPLLPWATGLLLMGAVGKSAQIPLFPWLPDAMEGPTPVSALMHAATMVTAGVYLIVRAEPLFRLTPEVGGVAAGLGAATAVAAALMALTQPDIKKVLAYSTVSQLGLMFLALGVGAYWAALFHVVTHAFFKAQLFLGAGSVIHALDGEQDMRRMGGLRRRMPQTYRTMLLGALALAGAPGLAGFFSKDSILTAAWAASPALFAAGLLTALLTAFYMGRLCLLVFGGEYRGGRHVHESPKRMTVPLWVLSVGSLGAGWLAGPFAAWLGASPEAHSWSILAASALVAMVGLGGAYRVYGGGAGNGWADGEGGMVRWLRGGGGVDGLYARVVVRGLARGGGEWLAAWDRGVIDGGVDGAGWLGRRLGAISKWNDMWVVDGLVRLTAFSVKASSFPVRYAQSGMAQSYGVVIVLSLAAMAGWYLWRSA